jgi:hypothetical protein
MEVNSAAGSLGAAEGSIVGLVLELDRYDELTMRSIMM